MMIRQGNLLLKILTVSGLALCSTYLVADDSGSLIFTFSPKTPFVYIDETTSKLTTIASGVDPATDVLITKTRITIDKEGDGFKIVTEPLSHSITRDGRPVSDPMKEALLKTIVTYHLSADGRLKSIDGYKGLLETVKTVTDKRLHKAISLTLNERALVEKETAQWNSRVGDYLGKPAVRLRGFVSDGITPLPDGSSGRFYVVSVVDGIETSANGHQVRIKYALTNERDKVQSRANDLVMNNVIGLPPLKIYEEKASFKIEGEGEKLIDPISMITLSDSSSRTIQLNVMDPKGKGVPLMIQESRQSKVTIEKPVP